MRAILSPQETKEYLELKRLAPSLQEDLSFAQCEIAGYKETQTMSNHLLTELVTHYLSLGVDWTSGDRRPYMTAINQLPQELKDYVLDTWFGGYREDQQQTS